jgi:hypothetical protein
MENGRDDLFQQEQQHGLGDKADVAQSDDIDVGARDAKRNEAGFFPNYKDHFSLHHPTSDVRFRGTAIRVYELQSSQIQLVPITRKTEDAVESISDETARRQGNDDLESREHSLTIELKEVMADRAFAFSLLRTTYTLVALFFMGIVSSAGRQSTFRSHIPMKMAFAIPILIVFLAVRLQLSRDLVFVHGYGCRLRGIWWHAELGSIFWDPFGHSCYYVRSQLRLDRGRILCNGDMEWVPFLAHRRKCR